MKLSYEKAKNLGFVNSYWKAIHEEGKPKNYAVLTEYINFRDPNIEITSEYALNKLCEKTNFWGYDHITRNSVDTSKIIIDIPDFLFEYKLGDIIHSMTYSHVSKIDYSYRINTKETGDEAVFKHIGIYRGYSKNIIHVIPRIEYKKEMYTMILGNYKVFTNIEYLLDTKKEKQEDYKMLFFETSVMFNTFSDMFSDTDEYLGADYKAVNLSNVFLDLRFNGLT